MSRPARSDSLTSKPGRVVLLALTAAVAIAAITWTVTSASAMSTTFDEPHHLMTGLVCMYHLTER